MRLGPEDGTFRKDGKSFSSSSSGTGTGIDFFLLCHDIGMGRE